MHVCVTYFSPSFTSFRDSLSLFLSLILLLFFVFTARNTLCFRKVLLWAVSGFFFLFVCLFFCLGNNFWQTQHFNTKLSQMTGNRLIWIPIEIGDDRSSRLAAILKNLFFFSTFNTNVLQSSWLAGLALSLQLCDVMFVQISWPV